MNKKIIIVLLLSPIFLPIILFAIFMLICYLFPNLLIFINWGVYLPVPTKVEEIYTYDWREGNDLYIFSYSKRKYDKLIDKFTEINSDNVDEINEILSDYYEILDYNKRCMYDNNVYWVNNKSKLIGNYFYTKKDLNREKGGMIIIAENEANKIYVLLSTEINLQ